MTAIRGLDAAVICLQEAWLPAPAALGSEDGAGESPPADAVAAAARLLGAALYRVPVRSGISLAEFGLASRGHVSAGLAASRTGDLCLAVLTALPVTGYEVRSLGRAPADHAPRLAQVICLRLANDTSVRIVNTHLTHRLTSPLQLGLLWRYLRQRPVPTVIAGDLNMPRLIAARLAGFTPAVSGRSWPAWQPVVQLDHVLIGQEIVPAAGAVLAPAGSDHLPIRAMIAIGASAKPERAGH